MKRAAFPCSPDWLRGVAVAPDGHTLAVGGDRGVVDLTGTMGLYQISSMLVVLDQTPLAEGAILAIDNHTGQIRAMVGGWSFNRSKFNRSIQALRQIGSTFKPIVYTAAIDRGYTPTSIINDMPVSYPQPVGEPYSPSNYDHDFLGNITLRYALEESRNIPAIKMMDMLGPKTVLDYAKRFGFEENFPPYLPIALGAGDATLIEVTSAYTAFPNGGVRMKPFMVLNGLQ